jgi:hypothetical protein
MYAPVLNHLQTKTVGLQLVCSFFVFFTKQTITRLLLLLRVMWFFILSQWWYMRSDFWRDKNDLCLPDAIQRRSMSTSWLQWVVSANWIFSLHTNFDTIDDCASQPCLNQGICAQGPFTYDCKCVRPYTGKRCESISSTYCKLLWRFGVLVLKRRKRLTQSK